MNTKFPSIEKLRHLISNLQHSLDSQDSRPIPLLGTTKLHGAHVDIVIYPDSSIRLQSRNVLDLTPSNDVHSFAKWVAPKTQTILTLHDAYHTRFQTLNPTTPISPTSPLILACEFIGRGIQKNVAIAQLDPRLVILTAQLNNTWLPTEPYSDITAEDDSIYHVVRGGVWHLTLDLSNPSATEAAMNDLVQAVEQSCPFGKTFAIDGTGEGIVWSVADTARFNGPRFWCKTKGEKHAVSCAHAVDGRLQHKEKLLAFTDAVVTEPRLEQGLAYLEEMGVAKDVASTGVFVKWLAADCLKEEREEIREKGIDEKQLRGAIAAKGSAWFRKHLEER
jgi:hypothetical protein